MCTHQIVSHSHGSESHLQNRLLSGGTWPPSHLREQHACGRGSPFLDYVYPLWPSLKRRTVHSRAPLSCYARVVSMRCLRRERDGHHSPALNGMHRQAEVTVLG